VGIFFGLKKIILSSNNEIIFSDNSITLIIGPNNSGKSTLLREINNIVKVGFTDAKATNTVIKNIEFKKEGGDEANKEFLSTRVKRVTQNGRMHLQALNINTPEENAKVWWEQGLSRGFYDIASLYCNFIDATTRLHAASSPSSIDTLSSPPTHPIHVLYENDEIENKFNKYCQDAFGSDLVINRGGGAALPLHIGKKPVIEQGEDRVSHTYLLKLAKLPKIETQGDGIRSYLGCLFSVLVTNRPITLLDEPEVFLHPPQARMLGRLLASEHKNNQLLIASHSGDILRGLLNSSAATLNVVRLSRKGEENFSKHLVPEDLKKIWADPILRFSNILDGLFHETVVLCESDSDCRFYAAVYDWLVETNSPNKVRDIFFTSTGGKDRMPVVVSALKKIDMPTNIIADFDILSDQKKFQKLFQLLGGNWSDIATQYTGIKTVLESKSQPLSATKVKQNINTILKKIKRNAGVFSEDLKDEIKSAMKVTSPWSLVKNLGKHAIPTGTPTQHIEHILSECTKIGFWIVPNGELESFDTSISGHGPSWVAKVLEKNLASASFNDVKDFIRKVVALP
jgi:predicted ATPase